ncbi:hypothetical protein [Phormidium sp. CCY1219]|uniref:hypothetical protein n=1 Tax=Phormidium sp. CCY1219 TaxID=2886104 RepID=UPI002D1F7487|nr:hypothetical protein [Phormidium sp. CCY1219]MEB3826678.1 hypothetical protein [Phormidium sp. CCY1219]
METTPTCDRDRIPPQLSPQMILHRDRGRDSKSIAVGFNRLEPLVLRGTHSKSIALTRR